MTVQEAYKQLLLQLYDLYNNREAGNIADLAIEHITGLRKIDRILNKQMPVSATAQKQLDTYAQQLLQHTPVQYVLNEAWFAGLKLYVDENVLIPRPETEELVEWIAQSKLPVTSYQSQVSEMGVMPSRAAGSRQPPTILDIGTGSGCIPIALKKKFPSWDVHALDVSAGALQVAQKNAAAVQAPITFHLANILDETQWSLLPQFDIIASNPPYIKQSDEATMLRNVTRFEPHTALFVPDEDALLFYKKITDFALLHLHENGLLFFEINESLGAEVCGLLMSKNFTSIELRKDLQGKDRMVKATCQN